MSSACRITKTSAKTGEYIRKMRSEARLTQRQLADALGCQQPAIARLEAGEAMPNLTTLRRISEALGFDLEIRMVRPSEGPSTAIVHRRS